MLQQKLTLIVCRLNLHLFEICLQHLVVVIAHKHVLPISLETKTLVTTQCSDTTRDHTMHGPGNRLRIQTSMTGPVSALRFVVIHPSLACPKQCLHDLLGGVSTQRQLSRRSFTIFSKTSVIPGSTSAIDPRCCLGILPFPQWQNIASRIGTA